MSNHPRGYTHEEIETIAFWLTEKWSATRCAANLTALRGRPVTRNAIIGIVARNKRLRAIGLHSINPRNQKPSRKPIEPPKVKPIAGHNPFGKKGIAGVREAKAKPQPSNPPLDPRSMPVWRESKVHGGGVASAVRARLVPAENRPAVPAERVFVGIPTSRRLTLMQLTPHTCKWPHGDPLTEDFHFCGNDTAESGPYCPYHARLAYAPRASSQARVAA